tara:strand:+ start:25 stop:159 length:135 start_codon:yes stop_codon:yes gene_type:complete
VKTDRPPKGLSRNKHLVLIEKKTLPILIGRVFYLLKVDILKFIN